VAVIVVYSMSRVANDVALREVDEVISRNDVEHRVVPWVERAEVELRRMLAGPSGIAAAHSIQGITHPTGSGSSLRTYDFRRVGSQLSVRISTSWRGAFSGDDYTTDVVWEFDGGRHIAATVVSDSALVGVASLNARKLDDFFRLEFYPVLRSNIGD
jgi:hypothetical protein